MEKYHFTDLSKFCEFLNLPEPEHPLLSVVTQEVNANSTATCSDEPIKSSNDFYTISLKKVTSGEILYGRTKYDYQNGSMIFTAPRQEIEIRGVNVVGKATLITFHEDFIKGYEIRDQIKKYHFFSYSANEALHLSPKEEKLVDAIMTNIETEYHNPPDEFSKAILLSQLDTLLKYANRFYKRQFLQRHEMSGQCF